MPETSQTLSPVAEAAEELIDYSVLTEDELSIEARRLLQETEHQRDLVLDHVCNALVCAWSLGQLLVAAKSALPHGSFGEWCLNEVGIPNSSSSRYIKLASLTKEQILELRTKKAAYEMIGIMQREPSAPSLPQPPAHYGWINRLVGFCTVDEPLDSESEVSLRQLRDKINERLGEG